MQDEMRAMEAFFGGNQLLGWSMGKVCVSVKVDLSLGGQLYVDKPQSLRLTIALPILGLTLRATSLSTAVAN